MYRFNITLFINTVIEYLGYIVRYPHVITLIPRRVGEEVRFYCTFLYFRLHEMLFGRTRFDCIKTELAEMMQDQKNIHGQFDASLLWEDLYGVFIRSLYVEGIENFKVSRINSYYSNLSYSDKLLYRNYLWLLFKSIKRKDSLSLLDKLYEPKIGGGNYIVLEGKNVSFDLLQSLDEYYSLYEYVPSVNNPVILELGAGYGRLAYIFLSVLKRGTYIIVDHPISLIVAQYYLKKVFPKLKILTYRESKKIKVFTEKILSQYQLIFLCPWNLEKLKDKSIDMFINIYSFQEMKLPTIHYYFSEIERLCLGVFYNKQLYTSMNKKDRMTVHHSEYPYGITWKKIFSKTSIINPIVFEDAYKIM